MKPRRCLLERVGDMIAAQAMPRVALDLSGVASCDVYGINAFVRLYRSALAAGRGLVLLRPRPQVTQLLDRTGIGRIIPIATALPGVPGLGPATEPV